MFLPFLSVIVCNISIYDISYIYGTNSSIYDISYMELFLTHLIISLCSHKSAEDEEKARVGHGLTTGINPPIKLIHP